ncbi:MAG: peroxiredoxin [Hyphomicrobium sp.]|uniref:peroxiredoxin n=1 Tax=Hyphomicrobium sp. TaxID=82 RepID=UPI003D0FB3C2
MADQTFTTVDWTKLPVPEDDGAARHLVGARVPDVALPSSAGGDLELAKLAGRTVLFAYPMTGTPGVALPDGWDAIPGARGCTPHACAFRDLHADLGAAGAAHVFGISTQTLAEQQATVARLHLPFPLLSDVALALANALKMPAMQVDGKTMLRRLALIIDAGVIAHVFYPIFPPDRNAGDVLAWLEDNPR